VKRIVAWLGTAASYRADQIESLSAWGGAYKHLAQIELYLSGKEKARHYLTVALSNLGQVLERSPEYGPAILERNEVVAELARIKKPFRRLGSLKALLSHARAVAILEEDIGISLFMMVAISRDIFTRMSR